MLETGERREVECPGCGQVFEEISTHWKKARLTPTQKEILEAKKENPEATDTELANQLDRSQSYVSQILRRDERRCSRPSLSARERELTAGLVMGDGWLTKPRETRDGRESNLVVSGSNVPFLEWLSDEFGVLSCGVRLSESGEHLAENMRNSGFYNPEPGSTFKNVYTLTVRSHPAFADIRARWYNEDGIRYPDGLELTPLVAKMWYCSDGGLSWSSPQYPHAAIGTHNERERPEFLCRLFEEHGFSPTYSEPLVRFTTAETPLVLDWMGAAPPGFEYKWAYADRGEYDRLKSGAGGR